VEPQQRAELQRAVTRLADGERAAFRPVFDLAWPRVREVAGRLLSNHADAEDAAQCALLKVFARASDFDRERDALAWIVAIASYECLTIRRRTARRREAGAVALTGLADQGDNQEERAVAAQLEEVALAVMGELRPSDRETLRVAIFGEGERSGRPATFRKRLQRALGRLRAAWRDHGVG
jgi:RNA polymerase sigma factor (sigma-70 family)